MKAASLGVLVLGLSGFAHSLAAQHVHADSARVLGAADATMSGPMSANAKLHMELTPTRPASVADSATARQVAATLRSALAKYTDTAVAVADGYRMFMPNVKQQRVYHFTNYRRAALEAFRFDPARPTSLLYERDANGRLRLTGAMYTAPKHARARRLNERVPLSIGRWHKHVNWCLPGKGNERRWLERRDGAPLFGPESPVATRKECKAIGGEFHATIFGWMIHANVFQGEDLATVFGHDH